VSDAPTPGNGHDDAGGRPLLRVVSGDPTPEEVAALVAVVAARAADTSPTTPEGPPSRWAHRGAALRRPLDRGPGAWRASAWPT
jgi:hypothetical protein